MVQRLIMIIYKIYRKPYPAVYSNPFEIPSQDYLVRFLLGSSQEMIGGFDLYRRLSST